MDYPTSCPADDLSNPGEELFARDIEDNAPHFDCDFSYEITPFLYPNVVTGVKAEEGGGVESEPLEAPQGTADAYELLPPLFREVLRECRDCGRPKFAFRHAQDYLEERELEGKRHCCKQWTEHDETVLVGLYSHIFHIGLSFKPTDKDLLIAKRNGQEGEKLFWQELKRLFDLVAIRRYEISGEKTPYRSVAALERHIKEIRRRAPTEEDAKSPAPRFRKVTKKFEDEYNQGYILTCEDQQYFEIKSKIEDNCCNGYCYMSKRVDYGHIFHQESPDANY